MRTFLALLLTLAVGSRASAAEPIAVKVATDTSGASTRVVLTFAKKVGCSVAETPGSIKIVCDAPIPIRSSFRGPNVLSSWTCM